MLKPLFFNDLARGGLPRALDLSTYLFAFIFALGVDFWLDACYIYIMRTKEIKARVNKEGLMGSASREHRVRKGKGSYRRRKKHQKDLR